MTPPSQPPADSGPAIQGLTWETGAGTLRLVRVEIGPFPAPDPGEPK